MMRNAIGGAVHKNRANGIGGKRLTRGPLYHILSNPIYAGQVRCGSDVHPGAHDAIIDRKLWDEVQAMRRASSQRAGVKTSSRNPLAGKLFADGHRLTPSHASKEGKRYRYYVSHAFETGKAAASERWRVNANAVEGCTIKAIGEWLASASATQSLLPEDATVSQLQSVQHALHDLRDADLTRSPRERLLYWAERIDRVDLQETGVAITFKPGALFEQKLKLPLAANCVITSQVNIGKRGCGLRLVLGETEDVAAPNETIAGLLKNAFSWRERWFRNPETALNTIAREAGVPSGDVSSRIRLAYLAPDIVKALLDGSAPKSINAEHLRRLSELPPNWAAQRELLGFPQL